MTLQTQLNQILTENAAMQEAVQLTPELKEMQLISLGAQAELYEQLQDNMLILFQAVAEIYELIETGGDEA